ncbi:LysR family transcriptional regulator [Streptomyces griseoluteus]|jgi:DNA-binding transcriptional LysR family regulator|uniref:LysR family transcriptional regulator n=1 Tax=Streptomyces griseoluteus TaxID=29306 RepID=UPI0038279FAD
MDNVDLNLIRGFDALLTEGSVTGAAERLHTSAPAMSRTLGRLRRVFGDPLFVRAGRHLVPTARALELSSEVRTIAARARALFEPPQDADPATAVRAFDLQISDALSMTFTPALLQDLRSSAPGLTVRLHPESMEAVPALREGLIDLEIGDVSRHEREIEVEALAADVFVAAVHRGHPLSTSAHVTPEQFAAADHVAISRSGRAYGPIDAHLAELGLRRRVVAVVPTFAESLHLAQRAGLVCMCPAVLGRRAAEALELTTFPIPLTLPAADIGMAWHPRNTHDRLHRWLRTRVHAVMARESASEI